MGDLAVVQKWLAAADDQNAGRLEALSSAQVEIVGPRGAGLLPRSVLGEWLARSGFRSEPLRWFCGGDGRVVVEHVGRWHDPETGELQGQRVIGSAFVVRDGLISRYTRHDAGVGAALTAAALDERRDVVTARH